MMMRAAFKETLELLKSVGYDNMSHDEEGIGYEHFVDMFARIQQADEIGQPLSETKIGRWLGWVQGAAVASSCGDVTLNDMKEINCKWKD